MATIKLHSNGVGEDLSRGLRRLLRLWISPTGDIRPGTCQARPLPPPPPLKNPSKFSTDYLPSFVSCDRDGTRLYALVSRASRPGFFRSALSLPGLGGSSFSVSGHRCRFVRGPGLGIVRLDSGQDGSRMSGPAWQRRPNE